MTERTQLLHKQPLADFKTLTAYASASNTEKDDIHDLPGGLQAFCQRMLHQFQRATTTDALTGLPNRDWLLEWLKGACVNSAAAPFALILIDIDALRLVNRRFGHGTGDGLLRAMGERIQQVLRSSDILSRWDSDGFAVILTNLTSEDEAQAWLMLLQQQLRQPFHVGKRSIFVSASAGLAVNVDFSSRSSENAPARYSSEQLIQYAEEALEQAKRTGRGQSCCFDPIQHATAIHRLQIENELRQAIAQEELVVHYQPIIHLGSGKLEGFEALVRWQHPERGLLLPGEFIAIAEETGLIVPLGRWVLRQACEQLRRWQQLRPCSEQLIMSVNLSPRQLTDAKLVGQVERTLAETQILPQQLRLELTENVVMENLLQGRARLNALRELGISLSIDDFGTGYASMENLKQMPFEELR